MKVPLLRVRATEERGADCSGEGGCSKNVTATDTGPTEDPDPTGDPDLKGDSTVDVLHKIPAPERSGCRGR